VNFLADENIDRQIVERLRKEGHNVQYVAETDAGIPDDKVLDMANREGVLLLTADKDFGELVFRQKQITSGVILIRLAGFSPMRKSEMVATSINKHTTELLQAFTVIARGTIRIRHEIG
jgi:predicted nuclease of predicted toxin-antitoxin system